MSGWDEIDPEERASLPPLTRIKHGLSAVPNPYTNPFKARKPRTEAFNEGHEDAHPENRYQS